MVILFGNHDAWPGKQPFLEAGPDYSAQMKLQESMLRDWESWRRERWIDPLATTNVPERPRIECYGLNTVSFSFWNNVKAIGEIDETELNDLRCRMAMRDDGNVLRILETHHPIVFPYKLNEVKGGLGRQNNLKDAKRIAALLRNEKRAPPYSGISAFAHLMLAGHTHYGMPGSALPRNVRESYQQGLGSNQLQLVTGGLMLVKDRNAARKAHEGVTNEVENRSNDLYSQATVFKASQQFQILRFSCSPKAPWRGVEMTRHVMARSHSAGGKYRQYSPLKSETFFPLGA